MRLDRQWMSGRSSIGRSLQYKGAWCTPPRIFMDHQDEIIPHLEPGRLPSTVDPDMIQPPDKEKKLNQRPVRISAWKLAKLDSNEAAKACAKARASSSVLHPISSRPYPHDADHLSPSNESRRSSPVGNRGFGKDGASRSSPSKSSYPPSYVSREDSISISSSPQHSNLATSPMMQQQQSSNRDHMNPVYEQSSANQSPWSAKERERSSVRAIQVAMRNSRLAIAEDGRSSVFWDQEAGRFVASSGHSSSQISGRELLYTEHSIFYGSPVVNERPTGEAGNVGRGDRLPVFVAGYSQQNKFPSRQRY